MSDNLSAQEFGAAFRRFMEWATEGWAEGRSPFAGMLEEHFGEDPSSFPLSGEQIELYDLPNLQLALDAYLEERDVEHRLVGFAGPVGFSEMSLAGLVHDTGFGLKVGPVRRTAVRLDGDRSVSCVTVGLFLLARGDRRLVVLVMQGERGFDSPGVRLEVMASELAAAEEFVSRIRELMRKHNVYRGKVLALKAAGEMGDGGMAVEFPQVSAVGREDIVLPEGLLDTIELHTVEFARHSEALLEAGRHLRRGLLLHGPPGTGKTLTATYLIERLEGRTVVILTGAGLGLIGAASAIARDLQPSLVVLEDIDLVAHERTSMMGTTSLLFELLNEMDGVGEDADVIFLMTTNRADLLEPALASRPGRVDQALELLLPDADARGRLLDLFTRGLESNLKDRGAIIDATAGGSPAFLRELVRKAALCAIRDEGRPVADEHFKEALALFEQGGSIMRSLLGADGGAAATKLADGDWDDEDDWEDG